MGSRSLRLGRRRLRRWRDDLLGVVGWLVVDYRRIHKLMITENSLFIYSLNLSTLFINRLRSYQHVYRTSTSPLSPSGCCGDSSEWSSNYRGKPLSRKRPEADRANKRVSPFYNFLARVCSMNSLAIFL